MPRRFPVRAHHATRHHVRAMLAAVGVMVSVITAPAAAQRAWGTTGPDILPITPRTIDALIAGYAAELEVAPLTRAAREEAHLLYNRERTRAFEESRHRGGCVDSVTHSAAFAEARQLPADMAAANGREEIRRMNARTDSLYKSRCGAPFEMTDAPARMVANAEAHERNVVSAAAGVKAGEYTMLRQRVLGWLRNPNTGAYEFTAAERAALAADRARLAHAMAAELP